MTVEKKNPTTTPAATKTNCSQQKPQEICSDGSAGAFNDTEQPNAESDKEISDLQLDALLDDAEA